MSSLLIIIILGSIYLHSFNRPFYQAQYQQLNTAETMGITETQLETATGILLDYTRNYRDDLNYQLDNNEAFFNQKEIDHMLDVQQLYLSSRLVYRLAWIIFVTMSLYYYRLGKKQFLFLLKESYQHTFIFFGLFLGVIALFAISDFNTFWTNFHKLFFRNDLWLLNPATDRLIQMVPLPFFTQLSFNIIFTIVLSIVLLTLLVLWITSERKNRKIHIVLYEPEIPQNTGNIMRTAMATKAHLHLIEPLGFIYDDKRIKRSGMDYIDEIEITRHDNWEAFLKTVKGELYYVTRYGEQTYSDFNFKRGKSDIYLVFGKESTGIPLDILSSNLNRCMRIPMADHARSLNLSNCVALVSYEVLRQLNFNDLSLVEVQKGADWLRRHTKSL